jgi:hypothetical protein
LNYNPNPADEPWADTIGAALKAYRQAIRQAMSYNIQLPHDLGVAMRKMFSRLPLQTASGAAF